MNREILNNNTYKFIITAMNSKLSAEDEKFIRECFMVCDEYKLLNSAIEHDVAGIIFFRMKQMGIISKSGKWEEMYIKTQKRITEYLEEIKSIALYAEKESIEFILLKNSGISMQYMDDYGICPMGDIDVLVKDSDFMQLHRIIEKCGFSLKFRSPNEQANEEYILQHGSAEYLKHIESGNMWLEISNRSISGRWIRPDQEPPTDMLFKRAESILKNIKILSPEDNLLQVCLHTAKHSYNRAPGLRLHLDVERIVRNSRIDWQLFTENTVKLKVKTPVYFSLNIADELFNLGIPHYVLSALKPNSIRYRAIRRILKQTGLMHPHARKFTKWTFIYFQVMLYDSFGDILKLLFPDVSYMKSYYKVQGNMNLMKVYLLRIRDIVIRRSLI